MYTIETDGKKKPLIAKYFYDLVMENKEVIDTYIDYSRDYSYDFFGLKTLEKTYLYRINKELVEYRIDNNQKIVFNIKKVKLNNEQSIAKKIY